MTLRTRVSIAAIATAAAAGGTGAFQLPAASARAVTHTLTFTSVQQAAVKTAAIAALPLDGTCTIIDIGGADGTVLAAI